MARFVGIEGDGDEIVDQASDLGQRQTFRVLLHEATGEERWKEGEPERAAARRDRAVLLVRLEEQRLAFRKKFGRDPGKGDPLFFDPDAGQPVEMSPVAMNAEMLEAMRKAGTPPELVYAFKKTGLLGLGDMSAWPRARRREWEEAVQEYFALQRPAQAGSMPDPQQWNTEIPELQARPLSRQEHEQVLECIRAIAPVQARGMSVSARMELAAALLADACSSAYQSAEAQGVAAEGPARYAAFEDLTLRRAREIYAQGRA
jgi:hypothetical protein